MLSNDGLLASSKDVNNAAYDGSAAEGKRLGWYQVVLIFFLWSILGLVIEEVWMRLSMGVQQSRPGLVWGPFSPLYGTGAVLLTAVLLRLHDLGASRGQIFVASALVGGVLEQVTGWAMESFLGVVSWDYVSGGVPLALSKWVALPFLLGWGALGCLWDRCVMPGLLHAIGGPVTKKRIIFVGLIGVFLALDIFVTLTCFGRMVERDANIPPANLIEEWVDEAYDDAFVAERFQNWEDASTPGVTLEEGRARTR